MYNTQTPWFAACRRRESAVVTGNGAPLLPFFPPILFQNGYFLFPNRERLSLGPAPPIPHSGALANPFFGFPLFHSPGLTAKNKQRRVVFAGADRRRHRLTVAGAPLPFTFPSSLFLSSPPSRTPCFLKMQSEPWSGNYRLEDFDSVYNARGCVPAQ